MKTRFSPLLASLVLGAAAAGLACDGEPTAPIDGGPSSGVANVILISIDTLRSDHLGCYGYAKDTSPNIDEFCDEAVVFENSLAHAPSTLLSHASIFSSLLPHQHGARYAERRSLPDAVTTLTEVLRDGGYRTVSYNGGGQLSAPFGVSQGFDVYESLPGYDYFKETVERAIDAIDDADGEPFFLFLHSFEVHHPYRAERRDIARFGNYERSLGPKIKVDLLKDINEGRVEIDQSGLEHIRNVYNAEIRSMDAAFGELVDQLRRRKLYDRTLIVLTSDHGEEFAEHGMVGWHSHTLYDELLRVPLIVKFPGQLHAGRRVLEPARGIDVAPTILAAVELPIPDQFLGVDLQRVVSGEAPAPEYVVSKQDSPGDLQISSLRSARWKIYDGKLFDLEADPGEQVDLRAEHPEVYAAFELRLAEDIARRPHYSGNDAVIDRATLERLEALGYINRQHPLWKQEDPE